MNAAQIKILNRCKDLAGDNMGRRESFGMAIEWILNNAKPPVILLETGRTRSNGEGQSTVILAILAKELGVHFISVDFNPDTNAVAKELLVRHGVDHWALRTTLVVADSTQAISSITMPVCFCYLDSAQSPDLELQEATALVGKMTKPAAILIDDCGESGGKSVMSVPFLEGRGWKRKFSGFQRFLTLE